MRDMNRSRLTFGALDGAVVSSFLAYSSSATITPICLVVIARELSFTLLAGGTIEAVRSTLILVTLVTSGFLAARFGKAKALGVSSLVLGVGLLAYAAAPSYGVILLAGALLGVGGGVIEALINPLVQDLHPEDSGRYLNIANGFWSVGVFTTMILGGELLTRGVSWRVLMAVVGVVSIASGVAYLLLNKKRPAVRRSMRGVLRDKVGILRDRRFWRFVPLMFFGGGTEGAFTFWSASFIQLHLGELPRIAGIGTAIFAAGMIAGRFGSGVLVPQRRLWHLIVTSAASGIVVAFIAPSVSSVGVFLPVLFLAGLCVACFWPSIQSYSADRIPRDPTSLFILLSCAGIPGFGFASWIMGLIGDRAGLSTAFYVVPAMFAALLAFALIERAAGLRSAGSRSTRAPTVEAQTSPTPESPGGAPTEVS